MVSRNGRPPLKKVRREAEGEREDRDALPYLDTIDRHALDFDRDRLCSVTLSRINVYGCLVCGRFFQGKGKSTPAYRHGIDEGHHVYIHLDNAKIFVLPDNYESTSHTLDDIKMALDPVVSKEDLDRLGRTSTPESFDLDHRPYRPGFVGLNTIGKNDYMNVVLHALLHVPPLVKALVLGKHVGQGTSSSSSSTLVAKLAQLAAKVWNPQAFRGHVSPHEFLQEVNTVSKRRFKVSERGNPIDFLTFLLNALHLGMTNKTGSSVIHDCFQGQIRIEIKHGEEVESKSIPFLTLALDLPLAPVFQDSAEKNIIPQIPLTSLLSKYNGAFIKDSATSKMTRYQLTKLPRYLIFYMKRFSKSAFVDERNPTIVTFSPKNLDLSEYLPRPASGQSPPTTTRARYDLLANIFQDSSSSSGRTQGDAHWQVHVHTRPDGAEQGGHEKWFQIRDLRVEQVNAQMIILGESYIQIWEQRRE